MRRAIALLLLAVFLPRQLEAARSDAVPEGTRSLAGQLLVAEPGLGDPNFSHTVVLMVQHDGQGALGLVLNRPYGRAPAGELLKRLGVPDAAAHGDIELCYGGPVQPEVGMVVHSAEYVLPDTRRVTTELSVTSSPEILRAIGTGHGPERAIAILGYAGWGPGQLESEIVAGSWFTIPADPALVFAADPAGKWPEAVKRRGVDL
jgi:putative transcriptional regulator